MEKGIKTQIILQAPGFWTIRLYAYGKLIAERAVVQKAAPFAQAATLVQAAKNALVERLQEVA